MPSRLSRALCVDVLGVVERRERRRLRQRVHVERLAHAVEHVGDGRLRDAVADAQAGEAVGLRERARHDEVRVTRDPGDGGDRSALGRRYSS